MNRRTFIGILSGALAGVSTAALRWADIRPGDPIVKGRALRRVDITNVDLFWDGPGVGKLTVSRAVGTAPTPWYGHLLTAVLPAGSTYHWEAAPMEPIVLIPGHALEITPADARWAVRGADDTGRRFIFDSDGAFNYLDEWRTA
jgi:hypothetical protein